MSYRCLKCEGVIYDRKVTLCPHCGGDLPPDSLFVSSGMTASDPEIEGVEVPVALLARAWAEMSKVRSDARGSRRAAARYFSDGIASGLPSQLLIKWLFFWPNERESAFGQAGFSARAGRDFVKMVKELTVREALASDDERPAATSAIAKDSNITAENICAEARAQIMWGEPAPVVRDLLASKGVPANEADARVQEFSAARNAEIKKIGIRSILVGLAILCGGGAVLYPCFRYFDSLTHINRPIFFIVSMATGIYGTWNLLRGAAWLLRPQAEHNSISDIGG